MHSYVLGVDPGKTGALALLNTTTNKIELCFDVPTKKVGRDRVFYKGKRTVKEYEKLNTAECIRLLSPYIGKIKVALIEMVANQKGEGTSSSFSFGENYGGLQVLIEALDIELLYIPPGNWQKFFGLKLAAGSSGGLGLSKSQLKKEKKELNARYAKRLHPEVNYHGPRGGLKDGRADAVLIAEYLKSHLSLLNFDKAS